MTGSWYIYIDFRLQWKMSAFNKAFGTWRDGVQLCAHSARAEKEF